MPIWVRAIRACPPHAQARDFYVSAMRVETDQGLVPSEWLGARGSRHDT